MSMDLSEFYEVFFEEAEELLADMEKLLLALDLESPDLEELNAIFRAAHSIKGGASTFGMPEITEVTHVLESLLDKIRKGELALTREHVDAFLLSQDVLRSMIEARRSNTTADAAVAAQVMQTLTELAQAASGAAAAPSGAATDAPVTVAAEAAAAVAVVEAVGAVEADTVGAADAGAAAVAGTATVVESHAGDSKPADAKVADAAPQATKPSTEAMDSDEAWADLATVGKEPTTESAAKPAALMDDPVERALADHSFGLFQPVAGSVAAVPATATPATVAATSSAASPVVTPAQPAPAAAAPAVPTPLPGVEVKSAKASGKEAEKPKSTESSTIRVGVEKVDELINMVGELVITHAMIEQLSTELDPVFHQRLLNSVTQLARNTRELQESVLGIRMLPMDVVFSRFPRLVRDLAAKLGKKIEFITVGAATELDKSLTERLVDPLTHLVRNSIDHGIEMPDTRRAAGKSETGRLTLSAAHQGGSIIIEVSDDGGGLNRERILAKAKQQGLPVFDTMADEEVWQLIFAPGFSTAEKVTDVSGRGVGMDVVKRNITAMGGSVEIRSSKGRGSNIRIALPLTLAILDGMSVKVGNEIYILGLSSVIESLQPTVTAIKDVMGQGQVIKMRDEYLPIIPLYKVFGVTPKYTEAAKSIIVILEAEGRKVGLMVDELVGQQQVVVKSLETNYRRVTGISGATILGDGSVALILDVPTLIRQSRQSASSAVEPALA